MQLRRIECRRPRGFTYLGLLFLVALLAATAALAATTWRFVVQRDRERELIFVGREYRRAIDGFRRAHADAPQPLPLALEQLLGDGRDLPKRRYLRRLYPDPMTGRATWGLLRSAQGGILGVYSLSDAVPIRRRAPGPADGIDFGGARSYRDWVFRIEMPEAAAPAPPANGGSAPVDDGGAPPPVWPGGRAPVGD